ncbi:MAG: aminopeptidase P family protein [Bacteroidaceae bacterium]|nr:aminopeptidase P family protein [Bacteroidaceae bacterium]
MPIAQRLAALRELMRREKLAAFIFPSTDPHNGEYIPAHWKGREWISGFDGSAGTAVVTLHSAALWTDSRYFIAAAEQLNGTEYVLMKERLSGTPTIAEWIATQLQSGDGTEVGLDGSVCAHSMVESLTEELRQHGGMTLRTNLDPLREIWTDRPPIPRQPVVRQPMEYAGETTRDKLARIRTALRKQHADGMLVTALDDIAWTLNLRGSDVHCNPVFVSYLLIDTQRATLYIYKDKLTPDIVAYLDGEGVGIDDYDNVGAGLRNYFEYNLLLDPSQTNHMLYQAAREQRIVALPSPIPVMKAVKNEQERLGFRQAMLRDGIAMTKFLTWLLPAVGRGGQTELSVTARLAQLREEQAEYHGPSFDTITAYQEHGAIVHYEPTAESDIPLKAEGLLLIDSGGQYTDGTTDITRTIALGALTDEQRRVYTLVLQGHIRLQMLRFPEGATGTQLDAIARSALWAHGYNYLHGTGHGVGSFLNVHEGPHQIRMEWKPTPLVPYMTVTDEPGVYLEGRFGVRIENTLLIVPAEETECGRFLAFEPLTLCPIDTTPVIADMLSIDERQWLNDYHRRVRETLSPHLNTEEQQWLKEATKEI